MQPVTARIIKNVTLIKRLVSIKKLSLSKIITARLYTIHLRNILPPINVEHLRFGLVVSFIFINFLWHK